jgi:peptide/nickel transport system permease protein
MLETMSEDFILTARAKGLSEKAVRDKHAARTALLPVTTSLVLAVATVLDGGIITETVFSWPGMGEILVSSVVSEDIPVAVAAFSFIGVLALVGHFVVDMLYGVLDPRIRVSGSS